MTSIFFCAGLALGVVVGATLTAVCWIAAKRIAEAKFRADLNRLKQEGLARNNQIEEVRKRMTSVFGTGANLTERHKQILDEELSSILTKRPAPQGR